MTRSIRHKMFTVVGLGVVLAVLVWMNTPGMNGVWYGKQKWATIEGKWFLPPMVAAYLLHLFGQRLYAKYGRVGLPLMLLGGCTLAMSVIGRGMEDVTFSLRPMTYIVSNPLSAGYYDDARRLVQEPGRPTVGRWLETYPEQLPRLLNHPQFKPPGLVLGFYGLIRVFGAEQDRAARIGAWLTAILAAAGVGAVYWMLRVLLRNRSVAFAGAAYYAVCPAIIVYFPQVDVFYPLLTCAMVGLWQIAIRGRWTRINSREPTARASRIELKPFLAAVGFGTAFSLAIFLSYVFFILGVTVAGLSVLVFVRLRWRGLRRVLVASVIATATIVVVYGLLWLATGFDPIATCRAIVSTHSIAARELGRLAYPLHVPFDLIEFFAVFGWLGVMLVGFYFARGLKEAGGKDRRRVAWVALAQLLIVAVVGLWPGETARIWIPMIPVVLVPVALELSDWGPMGRGLAITSVWVLTTVMWQNLRFVA